MYNEELKARFIKQYTQSINTAKVCHTLFEVFEPYENQWGADLCTRSKDELQPVVDSLVGFRSRSKWIRIISLKDYVKWCIVQEVPGACDGMLHINTIGLDKVRMQTVSSPKQLQLFLNSMCAPESDETTDNIYRCYYWLAFAGMPEEYILDVKTSDVDFETLTVRYNNIEYPMYRDSLLAFKNCVRLNQFVYRHPNYEKRIDRVAGYTLIRGLRKLPTTKSLRVELSRRNRNAYDNGITDKKLSYYRVWLSGLFYEMYEREKAGLPVNFTNAAQQFIKGKEYKLDTGRNQIGAKLRQVEKDYLEDYQRWKLAFFL